MTKETALKVIAAYIADKAAAEKNRTGMFWSNPVFMDAYNGNYKTVVDGKEYRLALTGIDGFPPDGYAIDSKDGDYMSIKKWEVE